jgi:hypothetical protein
MRKYVFGRYYWNIQVLNFYKNPIIPAKFWLNYLFFIKMTNKTILFPIRCYYINQIFSVMKIISWSSISYFLLNYLKLGHILSWFNK